MTMHKFFFGAKDRATGRLFMADYLEAENFDEAVELAKEKAREEWNRQNPEAIDRGLLDSVAKNGAGVVLAYREQFELTAVSNQTPTIDVDLGFHIARFLAGESDESRRSPAGAGGLEGATR